MDKDQIKRYIAEKVSAGVPLSKIQDMLGEEKGVRMTFMELRLIASELETLDWSKTEKELKPEPKAAAAQPKDAELSEDEELPLDDEPLTDEEASLDGEDAAGDALPDDGAPTGTVVELSKIVKPGMLAGGTVKFASGVTAGWFLDQYGRLGLENASGKPDAKDVEGFQLELQKLLSNKGL